MSEFSDSFHLRTNDPRDAETLLQHAGVSGFVIPTNGPFVTFVSSLDNESAIVSHNSQLLVHYWFGEDHGCWIDVFDGSQQLVRLAYEHEDNEDVFDLPDDVPNEEPQGRGDAIDTLVRIGLTDSAGGDALRTLDKREPDGAWGAAVAKILQLGPVSWLNWKGVTHNKEFVRERFPYAWFVDVT